MIETPSVAIGSALGREKGKNGSALGVISSNEREYHYSAPLQGTPVSVTQCNSEEGLSGGSAR